MSRFASLVLLLLAAAAPAHAQMLSLGLRGGASAATLSISGVAGEPSPGTRTSFLVGPTGTVWFSDGLAVQFEALYVNKGFSADSASGVTTALDLSYLDVPITAVFSLPGANSSAIQARLQVGTAFGFRILCSVDRGTGDVTGITDCNPDNVGTFDVALVGGAGLKIGRGRGGLVIDGTYTWGLTNINRTGSGTAKNRAFGVSIGYLFPIM